MDKDLVGEHIQHNVNVMYSMLRNKYHQHICMQNVSREKSMLRYFTVEAEWTAGGNDGDGVDADILNTVFK